MPRNKKIDAGEHLGVLHHVVRSATLDIPYHMQDEALSEGMVLLVQAARTYDPKHGVPPHYWLAFKIRNGLKNWKNKEARKHGLNHSLIIEPDDDEQFHDVLSIDGITPAEIRMELERLVAKASAHLDDREYIAVFGPALGLQMKELSNMLKANPNQIKELQHSGRRRIQDLRLL